jgi:ParB family chromosome partitioning protein
MTILGSGIDAININLSGLEKLNFSENEIKNIQIDLIDCGIYQPRKSHKISDEIINELVGSIREHGILQPIIVRLSSSKRYELIAGERRLKAAIKLGFKDIPAVIKKIDEQEAFAIALIENIQRMQLSILEEAEALLKLKNDFLMSNESVALMIGKPRTTITNLIRLASNLTVFGKELLERGDVEYGHIRCVLALPDDDQNTVLNHVLE